MSQTTIEKKEKKWEIASCSKELLIRWWSISKDASTHHHPSFSKVFIATQGYIRILIMRFSIISVWSLSSSCISYYLFIDRKRRQKTDSRDTWNYMHFISKSWIRLSIQTISVITYILRIISTNHFFQTTSRFKCKF